ncbi:MAG: hypothetical protein QNJ63_05055 [Calothrix sp. MO_192.B10]|nr:hypothetical protein [Calothrix sp. MO_192.B10]
MSQYTSSHQPSTILNRSHALRGSIDYEAPPQFIIKGGGASKYAFPASGWKRDFQTHHHIISSSHQPSTTNHQPSTIN